MKKIPAAKFKAQCLRLLDQVQATGEAIIITKRGKAVAKLIPVKKTTSKLFGSLAGKIEIVGDVESPVIPPQTWKMLR